MRRFRLVTNHFCGWSGTGPFRRFSVAGRVSTAGAMQSSLNNYRARSYAGAGRHRWSLDG